LRASGKVNGSGPSDGVLDLAEAVLCISQGLPCFAFDLHPPAAGQPAEPFYQVAPGSIDGAFGVLVRHLGSP
jgi:hypothetical protein